MNIYVNVAIHVCECSQTYMYPIYMFTYIWMYMNIYVWMELCIYVSNICLHTLDEYVWIYVCECSHTYMYPIYVFTYIGRIYMNIYVNVVIQICIQYMFTCFWGICIHTHTCTYIWQIYMYTYTTTVSTAIATPPKSTKSRNSDFLVSHGTNLKWDFSLHWTCTKELQFLDLVDFGVVAFLVETVILEKQIHTSDEYMWMCICECSCTNNICECSYTNMYSIYVYIHLTKVYAYIYY